MSIVSRAPRVPSLIGVVERVWFARPGQPGTVRHEWVLPTCRSQMIVSPGSSVFVGPKVEVERIERRTDRPCVGVSLAAGADATLTGFGGDETRGLTVPLDAIVSVGSMGDRLAEHDGVDVLDWVEGEVASWLTGSVRRPDVLVAAQAIRAGDRAVNVMDRLGVDRRAFVPEFRRMVGAGPKHYERICRFNAAVEAIRRPTALPLAHIAADVGYADQSHLTREIRHFGRTSPARLHGDGSGMTNHVESDKIFKT